MGEAADGGVLHARFLGHDDGRFGQLIDVGGDGPGRVDFDAEAAAKPVKELVAGDEPDDFLAVHDDDAGQGGLLFQDLRDFGAQGGVGHLRAEMGQLERRDTNVTQARVKTRPEELPLRSESLMLIV